MLICTLNFNLYIFYSHRVNHMLNLFDFYNNSISRCNSCSSRSSCWTRWCDGASVRVNKISFVRKLAMINFIVTQMYINHCTDYLYLPMNISLFNVFPPCFAIACVLRLLLVAKCLKHSKHWKRRTENRCLFRTCLFLFVAFVNILKQYMQTTSLGT